MDITENDVVFKASYVTLKSQFFVEENRFKIFQWLSYAFVNSLLHMFSY